MLHKPCSKSDTATKKRNAIMKDLIPIHPPYLRKKLMIASLIIFTVFLLPSLLRASPYKTITFPSKEGLPITVDLYIAHPETAPFIILFHRARWSRGEYREIAPKLNKMGFNCMAVDQRSGDRVNGIINETAKLAKQKGKSTTYLDALQDIEAAISYAKFHFAKEKLIVWGSSYSAALVLKIAGDKPKLADGVLAFAPGEYFTKFGKSNTYITESAKSIICPIFITSAKPEKERWLAIYQAIPSKTKTFYLPETKGVHGSEALWKSTPEYEGYWKAVRSFLNQFLPEKNKQQTMITPVFNQSYNNH